MKKIYSSPSNKKIMNFLDDLGNFCETTINDFDKKCEQVHGGRVVGSIGKKKCSFVGNKELERQLWGIRRIDMVRDESYGRLKRFYAYIHDRHDGAGARGTIKVIETDEDTFNKWYRENDLEIYHSFDPRIGKPNIHRNQVREIP